MPIEQSSLRAEVGDLPEPGRVGRWQACLMQLLDGAGPAPAVVREAERLAVWLLSVGQLTTVREGLDAVPLDRHSLLLRVVHADAGVRTQLATMFDLEVLRDEAEEASRTSSCPDYTPWIDAVTAEHLSLRNDPLAFSVATEALSRLAPSALPTSSELVARGRLGRIAAHGCLHDRDPGGPGRAWAGFRSALADLSRAGWPAEWAFTCLWFSVTFSIITYDRVAECLVLAEEGATRLRDLGATYAPIAQLGLALVAILAGEPPTAHTALATAESCASLFPWPLDGYGLGVRAVIDLLATGPTPGVVERLGMLRLGAGPLGPGAAGSLSLTIGHILCDFGAVESAVRWLELSDAQQAASPAGELHRVLLTTRIRLLGSHDLDACDDVMRVAATYDTWGYATFARMARLRLARDLERIGEAARAPSIREQAAPSPPSGERRLFWEAVLAIPLESTPGLTGRDPAPVSARRIELLRPEAVVRIGSDVRTLPNALARLLCVLACAAGPLTVDRVAERLWPEIDLPTARSRLNVALYRLRKAMADPDIVERDQETVRFDPDGHWEVDVCGFRRYVSCGDGASAFAVYFADLCDTQLAYDDAIGDEREVLRAQMIDLLAELLEAQSVDLDDALRAVRELHIDDVRVQRLLVKALRDQGRDAEAAQVETDPDV